MFWLPKHVTNSNLAAPGFQLSVATTMQATHGGQWVQNVDIIKADFFIVHMKKKISTSATDQTWPNHEFVTTVKPNGYIMAS
jgi:hypothetical protein